MVFFSALGYLQDVSRRISKPDSDKHLTLTYQLIQKLNNWLCLICQQFMLR